MKELLHDFDIKQEGIKIGRKEGIEIGRRAGEQIGKERGQREGKQIALKESIKDSLHDLGEIPEDLTEKIESTTDISLLQSWVKLAARSKDMEEFMDKMN